MEQNLTYYKIFYTVAKTGSFTKASELLFVSQPAISKSIQNLEESLNTKLFIRNSRGVPLTETGNSLFSHISVAFEEINKAENDILQINNLGIGSINISVSATMCKYILMPYLKDFIKKNPHVRINIECRSTTDSINMLNTGKTDIALIGKTDDLQYIDFHSLTTIHYIFVATSSYIENLKLRNITALNDIFKYSNIMLLDKNNVSRLHIDNYLLAHGYEVNSILEVNNMDLLIDFSKINMGIACVIREFVEKDLGNGRLIEIPLKAQIEPREIGFAYNTKAHVSVAARQFIEMYKL